MLAFVREAALALLASVAMAGDTFYAGTWKINSAALAPWADAAHKDDAAEMRSLVGRIVIIKENEITGPRQVACKGPKYKVVDSSAEGLFQGAFDEIHRKDPSVDPGKLAAKAGFKGTLWKTLETGCGNELDYHFIDADTVTFGLNNYIYYLKKQPAR